jgi:hypothetical protein
MPQGKKYTPEQIYTVLRKLGDWRAGGNGVPRVSIHDATLYHFNQEYGALQLCIVKERNGLLEEGA